MMRSAGDRLAMNNRNRRYGRNNDNPLRNKTSRHIEKYRGFIVMEMPDGLIKIEVNKENLGMDLSEEEIKVITEVLMEEIESFVREEGE